MDDTGTTRVSTGTSPAAAASTSSTPPEQSPSDDQLAELGERILAELGADRTNSTLTRWLAHHVASLIEAADEARASSAPDSDARAAEARTAILQLWQHRSSWPAGWPPPRAAQIASILEELPESSIPPWQSATSLARIHELHHTLLALLVDIVTSDCHDIGQGWLKAFGSLLTPQEKTLLTFAANAEQRMSRHFSWPEPAAQQPGNETDGSASRTQPGREQTPQQALTEIADAYRQAVLDLLGGRGDSTNDPDQSCDISHHAEESRSAASPPET